MTPPPARRLTEEQPDDRYLRWSPAPQEQTTLRTDLTAYCGIGFTAVAVVLVLAVPTHSLKLVGALMLACIPAGAAVMCWIDAGETAAQIGLTIVTSLALIALGSSVMIWTAYWRPDVLLGVVAATSTSSCIARLASRSGSWPLHQNAQ